jgi:hypothetical protein
MRIVLLLSLVSSIAAADPHTGNLRVAVACAETIATPERGLVVRVDGAPVAPSAINSHVVMVSHHGAYVPVLELDDIGYDTSPGVHRVEIGATSCASESFDATIDPGHSELASGRLAITDRALTGTVGAPNGFGFVIGAWVGHAPGSPVNSGPVALDETATADSDHGMAGGMISTTLERRHLAMAVDLMFGAGGSSGRVSGEPPFTTGQTQPYAGTIYDSRMQVRFGARAALGTIAIAAGSGLGFELWRADNAVADPTSALYAPDGGDANIYFPMWTALTVKPACDIGMQLLAQYDVYPTSMASNSAVIGVGLLVQPSDACRQPPGIHLHSS